MDIEVAKSGLRLLSLDGGGVRGVSELCVLRDLMERLKSEQDLGYSDVLPKPCDVFDIICGTSTGGLLAIMLGRLRMSIDECETAYAQFAKFVFGDPRSKLDMREGRFKEEKLRQAIQDTVVNCQQGNSNMFDPHKEPCRIFVCAAPTSNTNRARRLTSYKSGDNCAIWEAARATTAAPTFFKPAEICFANGVTETFVDGAMGCNNPALELIDEAQQIFKSCEIDCIISLGSGTPPPLELKKPSWLEKKIYTHIVPALAKIATDCQKTHEIMFTQFKDRPNTYFRFSATGVGAIGLEEWERLGDIRGKTLGYMNDPENREKVERAARVLSKSLAKSESKKTIVAEQRHSTSVSDSHTMTAFAPGRRRSEEDIAEGGRPMAHFDEIFGPGLNPMVDEPFEDAERLAQKFPEQTRKNEKTFLKSLGIDSETLATVKAKKSSPLNGTCEWFTSNRDVFQKWKNNNGDQVLVLVAPPGSGKSVLAKHVFENIRKDANESTTNNVFEHFCERSEKYGSARSIISALLYQLLAPERQLFKFIRKDIQSSNHVQGYTCDALWNLFIKILRNSEIGNIFCLIDGLDECDLESEAFIFQAIEASFTAGRDTQLKPSNRLCFFLTSRPTALATRLGGLTLLYEIRISDTSKDISAYVEFQLQRAVEAKLLPSDLSNEVKTRLNEQADGMFLWVSLNMERLIQIQPGRSRSQVLKLIDGTPSDIESIYALAFEQIRSDSTRWTAAQRIFGVLLFAYESLSVEACAIACHEWREDIPSHQALEDELDSQFELSVKAACSPFINIVQDQLQFCHSTGTQFLDGFNQITGEKCFDSETCNLHLAKVCLQYLLLQDVEIPKEDNSAVFNRYPFLSYALRNWKHHLRAAPDFFQCYPGLARRFFDTRLSRIRSFLQGWAFEAEKFSAQGWRSDTVVLHTIAGYGITSILEHIRLSGNVEANDLTNDHDQDGLELQTTVDGRDFFHNTPLMLAAAFPSFKAFQNLRNLGADINAVETNGKTILHCIARNSGEESLKIAKSIPIDTRWDVKDFQGLEPLHLIDDATIMEMILQRAAEMNYTYSSIYDGTAVYHATMKGNTSVVKVLIRFGARTSISKGGTLVNCLRYAAYNGYVDTFKALLEASAREDSWEEIAPNNLLHIAVHSKSAEMLKVLLELGLDINALDSPGLTPLYVAAYRGITDGVDFLLQERADANGSAAQSWTPLHGAVSKGHLEPVQSLLKAGALVDAKSNGLTPLIIAAEHGHIGLVETLLAGGAQPDATDEAGQTSLHCAANKGHYAVARVLIEAGAAVNARSLSGKTALHLACAKNDQVDAQEYLELVKLLLNNGAQIDPLDGGGLSPLLHASSNGSVEITRLLLEKGSNPLVSQKYVRTPLYEAVLANHSEILELLVSAVEDAENIDKQHSSAAAKGDNQPVPVQPNFESYLNQHDLGGTLLHIAVHEGHEDCKCAKILLRHKADPNKADRAGMTALHVCFYTFNVNMAKILLASGGDPTKLDGYGKSCIDWADSYPPLRDVISPWLAAYQTPSKHQRQQKLFMSVTELCRHLKKRLGIRGANQLGKCFVFLNELENAFIAFQQSIQQSISDSRHRCSCDGCFKMPIVGQRFACKICADTDLCKNCMKKYWRNSINVQGCAGHEYLEIPGPTWANLEKGCVNEAGESWDEWLARMLTTYEKKLDPESLTSTVASAEGSKSSAEYSTHLSFNFTI